MCKKIDTKISNRLGKNVRKPQGGGLTPTVHCGVVKLISFACGKALRRRSAVCPRWQKIQIFMMWLAACQRIQSLRAPLVRFAQNLACMLHLAT